VRILVLTHRLPYAPNRGDRIRAYHLLHLLAKSHDVDLVSLVHDDDERAHVEDLRLPVRSVTGVRVRYGRNLLAATHALMTAQPLTHALLRGAGMREVLRQRVAASAPDVVVAYCSSMARYAMTPPLAGIPFVFDMVDVDSEKWAALSRTASWPRRWVYAREARRLRAFERAAIRSARATTVASLRELAVLDDVAPGHGAVTVENGVDLARFAPPRGPTTEPHVTFCGVFNYAPNEAGALWLAREVWPMVRQSQPRARLTLVGMHPTSAVRALAADPSIRVTGAVPDVRPYLWESAATVAPLWTARGVQNKVLEALAALVPPVVTPAVFDGLPAAVRPACVTAPDARSFAGAIVSLLRTNPLERRRLARRADLSALTWPTQLQPLLDLLTCLA
jgi:polysaccharide biosynthesis protein PslH